MKKILYIIVISILLEVTLFNIKFYTTKRYNKKEYTHEIEIEGMEELEDGRYEIVAENPSIEILGLDYELKNAYIDVVPDNQKSYFVYTYLTDEANEIYYQVPNREIHIDIEKSKTLSLNPNGKSKKVKVAFSFAVGEIISINEISLNRPQPFKISIVRIIICCITFGLFYLLRPKSKLYDILYKDFKYKKNLIIGLFAICTILFLALSYKGIVHYKDEKNLAPIYNRLEHSLLEGKTYFEDPNNSEEILQNMTNPYDNELRYQEFKDREDKELWDNAYFEGKYYCYFGVIPVIVFYIPFYLLFNTEIHVSLLICFLCISSSMLLIILLHQVVKNYFKKASLGLFLILQLVLVICTGLLYFVRFANIYSIPILTGLFFNFLGINLVLSILNSKRMVNLKIFLGSLSLALVAGCRPQLIMGSIFLIPIFYQYLKYSDETMKKKISRVVCVAIPYIIVAIGLMYYNYIRFNSPFDFGANYNLTTNDMTKRGFVFARIPLGLVVMLFNPINMENVFPYIVGTPLTTNYLGTTIYEPVYGGAFFSVTITSLNLFIIKLKKYFENKKIWFWTCILCIVSALIIVIVDVEGAGILARYINDFSWLLVFSAIIIILVLNENEKINNKSLIKVVFFLSICSLIYQCFYYFVSILNQFKEANIKLWLNAFYLFQFWL